MLPAQHFEFHPRNKYPIRDDNFPRELVLGMELACARHTVFICEYGDPFDVYFGDGGSVIYDEANGLGTCRTVFADETVALQAAEQARATRFEHGEAPS
jgi:hypothetical protein